MQPLSLSAPLSLGIVGLAKIPQADIGTPATRAHFAQIFAGSDLPRSPTRPPEVAPPDPAPAENADTEIATESAVAEPQAALALSLAATSQLVPALPAQDQTGEALGKSDTLANGPDDTATPGSVDRAVRHADRASLAVDRTPHRTAGLEAQAVIANAPTGIRSAADAAAGQNRRMTESVAVVVAELSMTAPPSTGTAAAVGGLESSFPSATGKDDPAKTAPAQPSSVAVSTAPTSSPTPESDALSTADAMAASGRPRWGPIAADGLQPPTTDRTVTPALSGRDLVPTPSVPLAALLTVDAAPDVTIRPGISDVVPRLISAKSHDPIRIDGVPATSDGIKVVNYVGAQSASGLNLPLHQTSDSGQSAAAPSHHAARHVAAQIAMAVGATVQGKAELSLSPIELGRVQMQLSATEQTLTIAITAERPETADLIRRHVDILAQELRDQGYRQVNIDIGGRAGQGMAGQGGGNSADTRPVPAQAETTISTAPPLANRPSLPGSSTLDLRL